MAAVRRMATASSTEVPPNFMTTSFMRETAAAVAGSRSAGAAELAQCIEQLGVEDRCAGGAADGVVGEHGELPVERVQGRRRPTVAAMPPPRMRSRRGCGRSSAATNSTGCAGAVGKPMLPASGWNSRQRGQHLFARGGFAKLDGDALGVAVFDGDAVAVRADARGRGLHGVSRQRAEQLQRLVLHLLFFVLDVGNDVAEDVERRRRRDSRRR